MTWSFRLRFRLGNQVRINSTAAEVKAPASILDPEGVRLAPVPMDARTIGDTPDLTLRGEGYASHDDALTAAARWRGVLQIAFAKSQLGANFGRRESKVVASHPQTERPAGRNGAPVLSDELGVTVFETEPRPGFLGVTGIAGRYEDHVLGTLVAAAAQDLQVDTTHRLAYDLFGASFFAEDPETRLVTLVMATESLIKPKPRADNVVAHVHTLIAATAAADIPEEERRSIKSSLQWLVTQSIGQAGRELAATLGDRRYLGMRPATFFTKCYALRSAIAHGHADRPPADEVDRYAAYLEVFVADLLSGPLRDQLPPFELEGPGRQDWDAAVAAARARGGPNSPTPERS